MNSPGAFLALHVAVKLRRTNESQRTVAFSANWATRTRNVSWFPWRLDFRFAKITNCTRRCEVGAVKRPWLYHCHRTMPFVSRYSIHGALHLAASIGWHITRLAVGRADWRIPRRKHDDTILSYHLHENSSQLRSRNFWHVPSLGDTTKFSETIERYRIVYSVDKCDKDYK